MHRFEAQIVALIREPGRGRAPFELRVVVVDEAHLAFDRLEPGKRIERPARQIETVRAWRLLTLLMPGWIAQPGASNIEEVIRLPIASMRESAAALAPSLA